MRRGLALLAPGLALGVWLALGIAGLRASLDPAARAAVDAALGPLVATHGMIVLGWWLAGAAAAAWAVARLDAAWRVPAERMTDTTQAMIGAGSAPDIIPAGAPPLQALATAINGLAGQRRALGATMAAQIREASARVEQQRDQLAALMAELQQCVVVCNLEGSILLYNERATALSRSLSRGVGRGAELVGLGRPIFGLIDRGPIVHALEVVDRRLARGDAAAVARFVTAAGDGRLLRVALAPVRADGGAAAGYVLLVDDVTQEQEARTRRDRAVQALTEGSRASFAAIQAALEMLEYPDLGPDDRERFQAVVRDEAGAMAGRLDRLAAEAADDAHWPLQEMQGADLAAAAARRMEAETGQPVSVTADDTLWLLVDGFGLIEALAFLAGRLADALGPEAALSLRLSPAGGRAHLDLGWTGDGARSEAMRDWQGEPMPGGATVRDIVERHGGALWVERADGRPFFRFLLPTGAAAAAEAPGSRPEYYDFDLFAASAGSRVLDDRKLTELACTVFDTETTGLDPAGGDEILQIGALRILNGRLLAGETFDALVDPGRSIPEAGIAIHGIRPETVRGQPAIGTVLPAFHAFARDTVLVGHNVAFDLRFLALKEAACGVRFDQPVLDTLLLASLAQPSDSSHGLDEIAARLGVTAGIRHNALGDARTTAAVFLALVPLLAARGIVTLGEARAASQTSFYAGLRY